MYLETKRLILRNLTDDDFNSLYSVLADSDIMQHYPYTFDNTRVHNWILKNQERYEIFEGKRKNDRRLRSYDAEY